MASAEELIREAQFAFHNVGPGSTDEKRNRARAKKFAKRVLRRFPVSPEAQQARAILSQLDVEYAIATDTNSVSRKSHSPAPALIQSVSSSSEARTFVTHDGNSGWKDLWQLFSELPQLQKKILSFVLTFIVLFLVFTPFLFVFLIILFVKRDALRDLLHKVLVSMHPDAAKNRQRLKRTR